MASKPHYHFDWIYFNTRSGHEFLHCCDIIHKYAEDVIVQRREELLDVSNFIILLQKFLFGYFQNIDRMKSPRKYKDFLDILLSVKVSPSNIVA